MEDKEPNFKYCSNCKKDISAHVFILHESHCRRNIVLCDTCGEPVPRTMMEEHMTVHEEVPCEQCRSMVARENMEIHLEEECPLRMVVCPYCQLEVKAKEFIEHSDPCGSRTDVCDKCNQRVMLKFMEEHHRDYCGKSLPEPSSHQHRHQHYYDAKKSLEAAVTMEITNIGTQGYPGVGKTSVLNLAMRNEPAPTRTSTDCVDPPSRYLMIDSATEGVEWENVTTKKMFQMVCEAMKKTIDENPSKPDEPTVIASKSTSDTKQATPHLATVDPSPDISLDSSTQPVDPAHSSFTVFLELLKELSTSNSSGVIFNSHWMMVTDCGGQPPFLDAAALFLRNSCLQIFPVKLNEPLSKTPEFTYFNEGVCASFDEDCVPLTHKQIIETLAKSVASIQPPYTPSATKCPKGAIFTIVGTFKDEAHKCSETVEEKESILKKVLEPYKRFQVQLGKKVILPINAIAIDTETKKERTESAKDLGDLLRKSALDVSLKINMKLRWFGLLLSLLTIAEKENKAVLTLNECYQLGRPLGMDKSETRKAIQFFHDISLIMHFDCLKLRDFVIINTKPVLNKLSKIISVSFLDERFLSIHYKIVLPSGAKELLQYHGRFSRDTLEKCAKFTEPITSQFFLDILEHVKIAVAIDKESEYFMPCALSYAPEASVSKSYPPWVIRLRVRQGDKDVYIPIPVGYLPTVVLFLLTKFVSRFSTDCQRQYRNKIKLRYNRGGFIYLIERHLQLEIYFTLCKQLPRDCATIRNHILESICLAEEKLHIIQEGEGAITKVDSFLCSCGKGSAHHTCAYNPLSGILECESEEIEEGCKLDSQHLLWLEQPEATSETVPKSSHNNSASSTSQQEQTTAEDPPTVKQLVKAVASVSDWCILGLYLGLEQAVLTDIHTTHHVQGLNTLKMVMFDKWLKKCPRASWDDLIEALTDMGEVTTADQVKAGRPKKPLPTD